MRTLITLRPQSTHTLETDGSGYVLTETTQYVFRPSTLDLRWPFSLQSGVCTNDFQESAISPLDWRRGGGGPSVSPR